MQRGSALPGVGHASQLLALAATFPRYRSPSSRDKGSSSREALPFQSSSLPLVLSASALPACRLALRLPMGFWSLQRHPSEEPLVETRRPVRASVPLSGFRNPSAVSSNSEFRGLVSCRNRSWDPPFRAFPSRRSLTPLEVACFPAVIHQRAVAHRPTPYHRRFRRTPALSRACPLPPTTMDSLFN